VAAGDLGVEPFAGEAFGGALTSSSSGDDRPPAAASVRYRPSVAPITNSAVDLDGLLDCAHDLSYGLL
jgi:hypothetical protein